MAKILLVEDQINNMRLMEQVIEDIDQNIMLSKATTGQEALKYAEEGVYDLVLMDIALPDMDGIQTTKILKQYPHFKNVPVIAVTACAMINEQKVFREVFNDYVSKPVNEEILSATIRRWMGER